jgi:UDP-2-acetamido-2-deoxy-ribo-hexuluronate aminotransferase
MNKIQMVDLKSQYNKIKNEVDAGIQEVIDTTTFIKGGKVTVFQNNLEKYLGVKHVIPVGNGTDALQIALMALNLKPGDEVITPTFTFIATAEVVALLGLTPVLVDVDPDTYNLSVQAVEKAINSKTKAIIPVHLFGQNAAIEELMELADRNGLFIIEDACQSIGSEYLFSNGNKVQSGCIGHIGCTSFFPSKNLGCYGDGGAIFTNNDDLAVRIRAIANHGMEIRYHHDYVGVNSRLDSIQAAVLDVKLNYLNLYSESRQRAADYYDLRLGKVSQIKIPYRSEFSTHVFHQYTIRLSDDVNRDALIEYLNSKGVPAMVYYPVPLHLQKAYKNERYKEGDFPVAEQLSKTVLSLPMHTELDEEQLDYICTTIENFFTN